MGPDCTGRVKPAVGSQPLCLSFPISKEVGLWWRLSEVCRSHHSEQRQPQPHPSRCPPQQNVGGSPSCPPPSSHAVRLLPAPAICPLIGQVHVLPPDGASVQSGGRASRPLRTEQAAPATSPEVTPGAERPPRGRRQVLSARPVLLGHVLGARGPVAGPRGVHTHRDTWQGTLGCGARGAGCPGAHA